MENENRDPGEQEQPTFNAADAIASMATDEAQERADLPEVIDGSQIRPILPEVGGTEIIVQRHGKYIRNEDDPSIGQDGRKIGSLTLESQAQEVERGAIYLRDVLSQLPPEERDTVDVLLVASDTSYKGGGRRSYETAQAIQKGMTAVLAEAGLGQEQILNNVNPVETPVETPGQDLETGVPWAMPSLRVPREAEDRRYGAMLTALHPEFLDRMIAFEEDIHADARKAMGGEGPDEVADRTLATIDLLAVLSREHHKQHPGRRLIIWAATHYDTISPLVKLKIADGEKTDKLGVDYGGGITIDVDPDGHATCTIGNETQQETYNVPLTQRG